ncbi:type II toxin-antitoxin system HicB family antitoxin [Geofilum rubicundum]|uniref:HicB-like antitoxin of toxin-antitoxin system domain-containing protein n=1 Tax=Geofilum rubicundum JCM 15548 TaxID=1236989 RepID=A0A0E9M1B1_9BACT|nr:type II toxin-antitoxin system HicB family antitoxin [Geofilum rubicundum]GAO31602.1 hypothetical protein JCM15548_13980 [Geofilum rubicundum JCM 15548]
MATEVIARIGKTANNLAACVEGVDGFLCTASTLEKLRTEIEEGIKFHIEGLMEDGDPIPAAFKGEYNIVYKWDVESLMLLPRHLYLVGSGTLNGY